MGERPIGLDNVMEETVIEKEDININIIAEEPADLSLSEPRKYRLNNSNPYVKSFEEVIDSVITQHNVLSPEEETIALAFKSLTLQQKYLYVRLFCRKPKFLKEAEYAKYLEEEEVSDTINGLVISGFLLTATSVDDSVTALTDQELTVLSRELRLPSGKGRRDIVKHITQRRYNHTLFGKISVEDQILRRISRLCGTIVKIEPTVTSLFRAMVGIYLCANDTPFNSLVLSKMRIMNFPIYNAGSCHKFFTSTSDALAYLEAAKMYAAVEELGERGISLLLKNADDIISRCKDVVSDLSKFAHSTPLELRYSKSYYYFRLLFQLSQVYGQTKQYEQEHSCLELFLQQDIYLARKRIAALIRKAHLELFHFYREDPDETVWIFRAINSCTDAFFDPYRNDVWSLDLARKVSRLNRDCAKCGLELPQCLLECKSQLTEGNWIVVVGNKVPQDPTRASMKTFWRGVDRESGEMKNISVEDCALLHYGTLGYKGYHAESSIVTTLFAFLFWDIVFDTRPDMFLHPCQGHPIDMFMNEFYDNRKEEIDKRLMEVESLDFILTTLTKRYNAESERATAVTGLSWAFSLEDLLQLCECLGAFSISHICAILAKDYRVFNSGVPDLILWNYQTRHAKFSEVKSENDTLSDIQRVWIHRLIEECKVKVDLCRVLDESRAVNAKTMNLNVNTERDEL